MIERDPDLFFSVQKGSSLIPYDNGNLQQLKATMAARAAGNAEGNADASPEGW